MKKRFIPPPITQERLAFLAMRYVGRYAATSGMLRRVLNRHIRTAQFHHPDIAQDHVQVWVEDLCESYAKRGWIDDKAFGTSMVESATQRGLSRRKLIEKMRKKGLDSAQIKTFLATHDADKSTDDLELEAAIAFAKRKHLGIYRTAKTANEKKELTKLCRAGFSLTIARKALRDS